MAYEIKKKKLLSLEVPFLKENLIHYIKKSIIKMNISFNLNLSMNLEGSSSSSVIKAAEKRETESLD